PTTLAACRTSLIRLLHSHLVHLHSPLSLFPLFSFNDTAPTEIYTLSLHDALPISEPAESRRAATTSRSAGARSCPTPVRLVVARSEEHTSELQSLTNLVCRLLLEKKKQTRIKKKWCT